MAGWAKLSISSPCPGSLPYAQTGAMGVDASCIVAHSRVEGRAPMNDHTHTFIFSMQTPRGRSSKDIYVYTSPTAN